MANPPLVATFRAEAWVNDYAVEVDAEGPTMWNPLPYLEAEWPELVPEVLAEAAEEGEWVDTDDVLKEDPNAPQWVRDWSGPFTIGVKLRGERKHDDVGWRSEVAEAFDKVADERRATDAVCRECGKALEAGSHGDICPACFAAETQGGT